MVLPKKQVLRRKEKKKKSAESALVLTTMHDEMSVSKDARNKPEPIVYYDHMKGCVEIIDLLSCINTSRMKTRLWPLNANFFLCDTVRTNAPTFFNEINGQKL